MNRMLFTRYEATFKILRDIWKSFRSDLWLNHTYFTIKSAHLSLDVYRYRPLVSSIYFFFHGIFIYMEYSFTGVFFMIGIFLLRSYKLIENLIFILESWWFNKTFKLTKYKDSLSKNSCIITLNKYNN
jgi:hypothetical protein